MSYRKLNQATDGTDESWTSWARIILSFNVRNQIMKHRVSLQICKVDPVIFVKRRFLEQNSERCKVGLWGSNMQSGFSRIFGSNGRIGARDQKYFETFFIRLIKLATSESTWTRLSLPALMRNEWQSGRNHRLHRGSRLWSEALKNHKIKAYSIYSYLF